MEGHALNKRWNGYMAELKAAQYYASKGYEIFWSAYPSACDFIAMNGHLDIRRIQVKSAYWMHRPSGMKYLQSTTRKGAGGTKTYSKVDCDYVVISHEDELWEIPVEVLAEQRTVMLRNGQEIRRGDPRAFKADQYKVQ